jgi:polyisoprenoid-binding protein YceI
MTEVQESGQTFAPGELAGTWELDVAHTSLGFAVRHAMISTVRGSFNEFSGTATLDPAKPEASSASVTINAGSISTGNADRDAHLRSADFFDVETYPTLEFGSTDFRRIDDQATWIMEGELTIKGVTRPVEITFTHLGNVLDPWGNTKAGFEGRGQISRKDWGLTWNALLAGGGVLVADKIMLELEVEATKL